MARQIRSEAATMALWHYIESLTAQLRQQGISLDLPYKTMVYDAGLRFASTLGPDDDGS